MNENYIRLNHNCSLFEPFLDFPLSPLLKVLGPGQETRLSQFLFFQNILRSSPSASPVGVGDEARRQTRNKIKRRKLKNFEATKLGSLSTLTHFKSLKLVACWGVCIAQWKHSCFPPSSPRFKSWFRQDFFS